jgi:putative transposase
MPGRIVPLVTGEIYHVFNRGIDRRLTFNHKYEYERAIRTISFYRFCQTALKLSRFLSLSFKRQQEFLKTLGAARPLVSVICYCLMPNHFHLLLRQETDGAISRYLSNFQNSYTRYFNVSNERDGPLFMDQFKAVRIESEAQLVHVSRYIHLNPHTAFLTKTEKELELYPWSSFREYISGGAIVESEIVLGLFAGSDSYRQFVFDNADYQRKLKMIEHLAFE